MRKNLVVDFKRRIKNDVEYSLLDVLSDNEQALEQRTTQPKKRSKQMLDKGKISIDETYVSMGPPNKKRRLNE